MENDKGIHIKVSESVFDDNYQREGESTDIALKLIDNAFSNLGLKNNFKRIKQTFFKDDSGGFSLNYFEINIDELESISFQYISSQLPCVFVSHEGEKHKVSYSGGTGQFFYFLFKEAINLTSEAIRNGKRLEGDIQAGHIHAILNMAKSLTDGSFSLDSIRTGRITHHHEENGDQSTLRKHDFMIKNEKLYEDYFNISLGEMHNIVEFFFMTHEIMHVLLKHLSNPEEQEKIFNKTYYAKEYNRSQLQEIQADMFAAQHISMAYNYLFGTNIPQKQAISKVMSTLCWLYKFYELSEHLSTEDRQSPTDQPKALDRWNEIKWAIYGYDALTNASHGSDEIVDDIERFCNVLVDIAKNDSEQFL